ncbi:MAG TPA: VCBS repeat-containing protein [Candidatus Binatia bacterium]|nr:VCBS repeat-containing protein [Candidatus Binatia bacterium]
MRTALFIVGLVASASSTASAAPGLLRVDTRALAPTGNDGNCTFGMRVCIAAMGDGGMTRLRARGPRAVVGPLAALLGTLPGARAARRDVFFATPVAGWCTDEAPLVLPARRRTRTIAVVGQATGGRRVRARVRLRCAAASDDRPTRGPDHGVGDTTGPEGPPPSLVFAHERIDSAGGGQVLESVAAGDLDGDGRPDVVAAGDERLIWYRNPSWSVRHVATGQFGAGAMTLVRDVDGDGRPDIVTGTAGTTVWFANRPRGWERHTLSSVAYCHDLAFGDLDGDGRADAVCVDQKRRRVAWLRAPADPSGEWPLETIDTVSAMGAAVADVDRDGRLDVVAGRTWYRNAGDGRWPAVDYTAVRLSSYASFADFTKLAVLDLDGDGRLDVFATLYAETPGGQVWAFLQPADPVRERWAAVRVDEGPLFGVHSMAAASFDGSSRPQIMVADTNIGGFGFGVAPHPRVYVYRLLGPATDPTSWERTIVDEVGTHEAQAVDLDGDGLPDIVGHEENTDLVGRDGAVDAWRNATVVSGRR